MNAFSLPAFEAPAQQMVRLIGAVYHLRDENVRTAGGVRSFTAQETCVRDLSVSEAQQPLPSPRDTPLLRGLIEDMLAWSSIPVRVYDLASCPGVSICEGLIDPVEPEARHLPLGLICAVAETTFYWLRASNLPNANRADLEILGGPHSGRVVQAYREDGGRWRFFQKGKPAPFEQTETYEKRLIRDRLSADLLRSYARSILPGFDPDWKEHGGFRCYEIGGRRGQPTRAFAEEAALLKSRKGLGFKWF